MTYADSRFFLRQLRNTTCSLQMNQENQDTPVHRVGKDPQHKQPSPAIYLNVDYDTCNTAYQELGEITQGSQYDKLS